MIFRFVLCCLFCYTQLVGQWISFDLTKADVSTFKGQVEPTIISSALIGSRSTILPLSKNQRFGISVSIPIGWTFETSFQSNPLLQPFIVEGQYLTTGNLIFKGKINMFSNGEETVQTAGYGCNYFADSWFTSVSLGWLDGPAHLRLRYVDTALIMKRKFAETPILFGMGFNKYRSRILGFTDESIPTSIKNSITYLIAGTSYYSNGIDIEIQTQIHSRFIQLNLTFSHLFF